MTQPKSEYRPILLPATVTNPTLIQWEFSGTTHWLRPTNIIRAERSPGQLAVHLRPELQIASDVLTAVGDYEIGIAEANLSAMASWFIEVKPIA